MEKRKYRAAYFDLDGTLIRRDGSIDPRVSAKIRELSQQGVRTAIASGRPSFAAFEIAQELGISAPSMFFSGSLILDTTTREVHYQKCLSQSDLEEVISFCDEQTCHLELYTADQYRVNRASDLLDIHFEYLKFMPEAIGTKSLLDLVKTTGVLKLVIMLCRSELDEFQQKAEILLQRFALGMSYGASHSGIVFLNLTDKSATREAAFAEMIRIHGVQASEVLCFGDAEADLAFIKLAGLGVAMANAPKLLHENARTVCGDVDEDGVLGVLKEVFPSS